MKRPEYVAIVTKLYRAALDGKRVTPEDLRQLEAVFSRQGFTQGYYEGKTGPDMNYLNTDAVVKNSDQVVTTGSTLYPRGLLLGYITNVSIDETGVAKYATLEPSCELGKLEQIFIITQYANN